MTAHASPAQRILLTEIQYMLAALGDAKARDVVGKAARDLNVVGTDLDSRQALQILERIAAEPGLVGITARFAKSRAILRWPHASDRK